MPRPRNSDEVASSIQRDELKLRDRRLRGKLMALTELMRNNEVIIDDVLAYARTLAAGKAPVDPAAQQELKEAKSKQLQVWATQYNRYNITPSRLLAKLLESFNRVTFSRGNLRALLKPGQNEPAKEELAKLVEFCCDRDCEALIDKEDRVLERQIQICGASLRPERFRDLVLGECNIDNEAGIYEHCDRRAMGSGISLKRRHLKEPWKRCPKHFEGPVHFEFNYSSHRAVLRDVSGTTVFKCGLLWVNELVEDVHDEGEDTDDDNLPCRSDADAVPGPGLAPLTPGAKAEVIKQSADEGVEAEEAKEPEMTPNPKGTKRGAPGDAAAELDTPLPVKKRLVAPRKKAPNVLDVQKVTQKAPAKRSTRQGLLTCSAQASSGPVLADHHDEGGKGDASEAVAKDVLQIAAEIEKDLKVARRLT